VIGPTAKSAAIAALEGLVNRALGLDPASRRRLAALAGQVFHIECTQPDLDLFLLPHADRVQLAGFWEGPVTAGIRGGYADFIELLTSEDPGATLINGKMSVIGDSKALLRLRDIAADLDLDWEAPLTRAFGDVLGHQLGQGLRRLHTLARNTGGGFARQVRDYLKEESDWLAPRWQVDAFSADVARVALQGERLENRLAALRQRLARRQR
jgi:ubiquinone biosynthesis protein UbiJ